MRRSLLRVIQAIALAMATIPSAANAICPDLGDYYRGSNPNWEELRAELALLFDDCLLSSEYFALYGAAQLNTGQLAQSLESLERSLLLDPDNGAAMIDYATALLRDGQLFAAIEANRLILQREDIPPNLAQQVASRQDSWQSLTRQTSWQIDLLGGYDNNLNGAPDQDLITLTLSGELLLLNLSEQFRATSGPFINLRGVGRHRILGPENQHSFIGEVRGRLSEDSNSDIAQISARYSLLRPDRRNNWQLNAGSSHLFFAGSPLFSGTDVSFRYQFARSGSCQTYYGVAVQHQHWHEQSRLNGLESKLGIGSNCLLPNSTRQRINVELSGLHNAELKQNRLGGSREGWQFVVDWQVALSRGLLSAQYNFTRLTDRRGYSQLLANNARRNVERSGFLVQYRERLTALGNGMQLLINLYHQDQNSNLELFQTEDTSAEVGISWQF